MLFKKKTIFLRQTPYIVFVWLLLVFFNNSCGFFFPFFLFSFCFFSLILYFWKSNLYSRFLIFAFWFCTLKNPNFTTQFYLRAKLLAWPLSPPLDSPFSPPGGLCLFPPPSLHYPTLWISVCSRCGEHLRNWLLAGFVSLSGKIGEWSLGF